MTSKTRRRAWPAKRSMRCLTATESVADKVGDIKDVVVDKVGDAADAVSGTVSGAIDKVADLVDGDDSEEA